MPYIPPRVDMRLGAPTGRAGTGFRPAIKLTVRRVMIDSQGYDAGGAYWGLGQKLWFAADGNGWERWFRARDLAAAKRQAREMANKDWS